MTKPATLEQWAGSSHLGLTLVFTDIVFSTSICQKLGDGEWLKVVSTHFRLGRMICSAFGGYVVKVIGDSMLCVFRHGQNAFQFADQFSKQTGPPYLLIRVGIHFGEVHFSDNDIYGLNVNLAARVQHSVDMEGVHTTERAMTEYVNFKGSASRDDFRKLESKVLKNFPDAVFQYRNPEQIGIRQRMRVAVVNLLAKTEADLFYPGNMPFTETCWAILSQLAIPAVKVPWTRLLLTFDLPSGEFESELLTLIEWGLVEETPEHHIYLTDRGASVYTDISKRRRAHVGTVPARPKR